MVISIGEYSRGRKRILAAGLITGLMSLYSNIGVSRVEDMSLPNPIFESTVRPHLKLDNRYGFPFKLCLSSLLDNSNPLDRQFMELIFWRINDEYSKHTNMRKSLNLERQIEDHIGNLRQRGVMSSNERTAWLVYDLYNEEEVVSINADFPMQAASMIKPFVALAFFHRVNEGELIYGPKSRRNMVRMIQRSSNPATNWVLRRTKGPKRAQRILDEHYGEIFRDTEIVEYIPTYGRTYRNKASARDYMRFLRALWNEELPYSEEIMRLMSLPGPDRLHRAEGIPKDAPVYNKTGTTALLYGDMGIIVVEDREGNKYPYIVYAAIQNEKRPSNVRRWWRARREVIKDISDMVYREMEKKYGL